MINFDNFSPIPEIVFEEYLSECIKKQKDKNITSVIYDIDLNAKDFTKKINSFSKKYSLEPGYIAWKIKNDYSLARSFAIETSRQSIPEKAALKYLQYWLNEDSPNIVDVIKLPPNGSESLIMCSGVASRKGDGGASPAKSIDFKWSGVAKSGTVVTAYASHKYTNEGGGSQGNAIKELESFLSEARQNTKSNEVFFALGDGNYYGEKTFGTKENWYNYANKQYGMKGKAIACSTEDAVFTYWDQILDYI